VGINKQQIMEKGFLDMGKARIVVIDDEKIVTEMVAIMLKRDGYEVETFTDGAKALDRIRETPCDLVVTDLKMDGVDGFTIMRTVREECPGTPVIMLTAFGCLDSALEAKRLGAHDFFLKPARMNELKASIKQALASS